LAGLHQPGNTPGLGLSPAVANEVSSGTFAKGKTNAVGAKNLGFLSMSHIGVNGRNHWSVTICLRASASESSFMLDMRVS